MAVTDEHVAEKAESVVKERRTTGAPGIQRKN
jgi:hypothetical protein